MSFVLLVGAALLLQSLYRLASVPLGYRRDRVMTGRHFRQFLADGQRLRRRCAIKSEILARLRARRACLGRGRQRRAAGPASTQSTARFSWKAGRSTTGGRGGEASFNVARPKIIWDARRAQPLPDAISTRGRHHDVDAGRNRQRGHGGLWDGHESDRTPGFAGREGPGNPTWITVGRRRARLQAVIRRSRDSEAQY